MSERSHDAKAAAIRKNSGVLSNLLIKVASNEEGNYVEACAKLKKWLKVGRAYYQEAQGDIITIVDTAYTTLTRCNFNLGLNTPFSPAVPGPVQCESRRQGYLSVLETILPHINMFKDKDQREQLIMRAEEAGFKARVDSRPVASGSDDARETSFTPKSLSPVVSSVSSPISQRKPQRPILPGQSKSSKFIVESLLKIDMDQLEKKEREKESGMASSSGDILRRFSSPMPVKSESPTLSLASSAGLRERSITTPVLPSSHNLSQLSALPQTTTPITTRHLLQTSATDPSSFVPNPIDPNERSVLTQSDVPPLAAQYMRTISSTDSSPQRPTLTIDTSHRWHVHRDAPEVTVPSFGDQLLSTSAPPPNSRQPSLPPISVLAETNTTPAPTSSISENIMIKSDPEEDMQESPADLGAGSRGVSMLHATADKPNGSAEAITSALLTRDTTPEGRVTPSDVTRGNLLLKGSSKAGQFHDAHLVNAPLGQSSSESAGALSHSPPSTPQPNSFSPDVQARLILGHGPNGSTSSMLASPVNISNTSFHPSSAPLVSSPLRPLAVPNNRIHEFGQASRSSLRSASVNAVPKLNGSGSSLLQPAVLIRSSSLGSQSARVQAVKGRNSSVIDPSETVQVRKRSPSTGVEDLNQRPAVRQRTSDVGMSPHINGNSHHPIVNGTTYNHSSPLPRPKVLSSLYSSQTTVPISVHRGKKMNGSFTFDFFVDKVLSDCLSRWKRRNNCDLSDVLTSMCVSLACYKLSDDNKAWSNLDGDALRNVIYGLPSCWPKRCGLFAHIRSGTADSPVLKEVALAHPVYTSPDGFVDLSPFIEANSRVFVTIEYSTDMSDYFFLLTAHHPTERQLQQLAERKMSNENWVKFYKSISRPIYFPRISKFIASRN